MVSLSRVCITSLLQWVFFVCVCTSWNTRRHGRKCYITKKDSVKTHKIRNDKKQNFLFKTEVLTQTINSETERRDREGRRGKWGEEKECKTFMPKACHFSKASGTSSKTSPSNSLFSNPVCHIWPCKVKRHLYPQDGLHCNHISPIQFCLLVIVLRQWSSYQLLSLLPH